MDYLKTAYCNCSKMASSGLASTAARWKIDPPCISAKSKRSRPASSSSVEAVVKATKPTRITGLLILAQKCHARGKFPTRSVSLKFPDVKSCEE